MYKITHFICCLSIAVITASCTSSARFYDETYACPVQELTLGMAQKEIYKGMPQSDVAEALGSPNIVTKEQSGKETWIYDKIATEVRSSKACGLLLFFNRGCDQVSRADISQKTLTVVIKFDENSCVSGMSYHASKF